MRPVRQHSTTGSSGLERAQAYLEHMARGAEDAAERFSVQAALDTEFRSVIPRPSIRQAVRQLTGTDPGFDFSADGFTAMIGLVLAERAEAAMPRALLDTFASLVAACRHRYRYNYFLDSPQFAPDTDCTALSAAALYEHGRLTLPELRRTAQDLLSAAACDAAGSEHGGSRSGSRPQSGVIMVYWEDAESAPAPPRGRKHDPVACANALYTISLAQLNGSRGEWTKVLDATCSYVATQLTSAAYLSGTRYYPDPHALLFAVSRLCDRFPAYMRSLGDLLRHRLTERPVGGVPQNPLSLALWVIAGQTAGVPAVRLDEARDLLLRCQRPDGSWPAAPYYRMGRFAVHFGSPLLTTLFAVRALNDPRT
ncbi:hypothetical protein K7472_19475 [Streptomyces sp. PTM05]|uniref:Uncharacterized protein n=1 Tax=Streptantibioticus parmotrematis TaxID=2873249 RepID=A0ABS7QUY4_9ACTN|nr:hypothetical protein [Streptantibioticus parmotrematis]MBY8887016.1 hypothetical protein [Streptantibioticus parmotrematis]